MFSTSSPRGASPAAPVSHSGATSKVDIERRIRAWPAWTDLSVEDLDLDAFDDLGFSLGRRFDHQAENHSVVDLLDREEV
jgi:hypothetical protein